MSARGLHTGGAGRAAQTGRFASRAELTRHIWAMHRLQVFPNRVAIAFACGTTADVVRGVLSRSEGLADYLRSGCPSGAD